MKISDPIPLSVLTLLGGVLIGAVGIWVFKDHALIIPIFVRPLLTVPLRRSLRRLPRAPEKLSARAIGKKPGLSLKARSDC